LLFFDEEYVIRFWQGLHDSKTLEDLNMFARNLNEQDCISTQQLPAPYFIFVTAKVAASPTLPVASGRFIETNPVPLCKNYQP
jgi:hypothetical protein